MGSVSKTTICDNNAEVVGKCRRWETEVRREFEVTKEEYETYEIDSNLYDYCLKEYGIK
jgi:hypothetical protein